MFVNQGPQAIAVMLAFLLANVVFLAIVVLLMRYFIRVLSIPPAAWPPLIVGTGLFGAFAIEQRQFGMVATMAVGLLGYVMVRFGYPLAPALLAFVLGPILESNYDRLVRVSGGDLLPFLLGRPIAVVLLVLAVASLFFDVLQRRRVGRSSATSGGSSVPPS